MRGLKVWPSLGYELAMEHLNGTFVGVICVPPIRILTTNNVGVGVLPVGVRVALLVGLRVSDAIGVAVPVKFASRVNVARRVGGGTGVIVWLGVIVTLAMGVTVGMAVLVFRGWSVGGLLAWAHPVNKNKIANPETPM